MEEAIFLEAKGSTGQVELLRDRVRIRRKGSPAKGRGGDHEIPYSQLVSIELKSRWGDGYIYFVVAGQEDKMGWGRRNLKYYVNFGSSQQAQFEEIKRVIEQRMDEGVLEEAQTQAPRSTAIEAAEEATPWVNADHNLDLTFKEGGSLTLGGRVRKYVEKNLNPGESVEFFIVGQYEQTIVALQDRLLVVKCGMFSGATFGGRVTSFYYQDINGIEVNSGMLMSVIEINTPSYQGTQGRDYWNTDSWKVSNCVPTDKWSLTKQKPQLDKLRDKIREAKQEQTAPSHAALDSSGSGISAELEKLASLRNSGILTDEEFQQAKKKLLG